PIKLALLEVSNCETSRETWAERIACRRDDLSNRGRLALSGLHRGRGNEAVWDLVYIRAELWQVHAMRSSVGNIGEETRRQLTLKIQIPLLHRSILLDGISCCRKTLQIESVS